VTVNAIDGSSGKTLITRDSPSANKDAIIKETAKLIPALRRALGDVTPENQQMAAGETFTSSSLDAVHEYGTAQQLQLSRKYDEAIAHYQAALKADSQLGRAYAGIASSSYNQGRLADAEKNYKLAISLIDRMSEREKLRTLGGYALMVRDHPQAVRQFSSLVREYPYDTAGTANLAFAYCLARDMAKAVELGRKAVTLYRGNINQRLNLIMFLVYNGETAAALAEAHNIQDQKKAYVLTALAQVLDGHPEEAAKALDALQRTGPRGVSMALSGSADLAMYQGRFSDAASMLQQPPEEDAKDPRSDLAVGKALLRAEALAAKGAAGEAARAAQIALSLSDQDAALVIAAQVLTRAQQDDAAQKLAARLAERVTPEPRAWAKVVAAELLLAHGKAPEAIEELNQAQRLTDTWIGHFDLGRVYIEAGSFPQGVSEIDLCLKRRGEAASAFLVDDLPTIRYLPAVYYYAGRAQEGVGSPRAAESYKTFLTIKEKSESDPLVADARRRLAALGAK
jgi:tetratricopeptide (TPR) repeat protein